MERIVWGRLLCILAGAMGVGYAIMTATYARGFDAVPEVAAHPSFLAIMRYLAWTSFAGGALSFAAAFVSWRWPARQDAARWTAFAGAAVGFMGGNLLVVGGAIAGGILVKAPASAPSAPAT